MTCFITPHPCGFHANCTVVVKLEAPEHSPGRYALFPPFKYSFHAITYYLSFKVLPLEKQLTWFFRQPQYAILHKLLWGKEEEVEQHILQDISFPIPPESDDVEISGDVVTVIGCVGGGGVSKLHPAVSKAVHIRVPGTSM